MLEVRHSAAPRAPDHVRATAPAGAQRPVNPHPLYAGRRCVCGRAFQWQHLHTGRRAAHSTNGGRAFAHSANGQRQRSAFSAAAKPSATADATADSTATADGIQPESFIVFTVQSSISKPLFARLLSYLLRGLSQGASRRGQACLSTLWVSLTYSFYYL